MRIIANNVTEQQYTTWFASTKCLSFDGGVVMIQVPSMFVYEYLEEHYISLMSETIRRVFGKDASLQYRIKVDNAHNITSDIESDAQKKPKLGVHPTPATNKAPSPMGAVGMPQDLDPHLNTALTFDNFIEGDSNKLSRSIGLSIADHPEQITFNPFFIYGHSGVGKTHLVNAIGTRLKTLHPEMRVLYISAHLFMVQYTDAVVKNRVNDFIRFYQSIDTLIVDDVQEFQGVKATQNTFFHIFNHLHMNGKQIILTSDRPPIEMRDIEERMLTRFKWGLPCEIERPTVQLRYNILKNKIRHDGLKINEDVVTYISQNAGESVRDLEGIINSLMAHSVCFNCEIDLKLTEHVLKRTVKVEHKPITMDSIMEQVSNVFGVSSNDILASCRKANMVQARQAVMYLAQKHTDLSASRIGSLVGKRTHATVLHNIAQAKNQMQMDRKFSDKVAEVEGALLTAQA